MDLQVKTETPDRRDGLQWVRTRRHAPGGLVFIPPLIGGGPAQQLGTFRWLLKDNLDIFSFNYTGHGGSSGKFSLAAPVRDTRRMLSLAAKQADHSGLPLYGIAACYATIPLLYSALASGEPFKRIVLINPLTALYQGTCLRSFYRYCKAGFDIHRPRQSLKKSIDSYLEGLFPDIARSPAGFGSLSRERARLFKILFEWLSASSPMRFSLPQTPALCVYGRRDPILNLGDGRLRRSSLDCITNVCSHVTFHAINGDHFLSDSQSRATTRQAIRSFFQTG